MNREKLIDVEELTQSKSKLTRTFVKFLARFLAVEKMNRVYAEVELFQGNEMTRRYLSKHNIKYITDLNQLKNIPEKGGAVIVANHPTGILDGVVLIDLISRIRPDVKFMANSLLSRMEPLSSFFIDVNPFNSKNAQNISGVKKCIQHVQDGGVLVIFPAGAVATIQWNLRITDFKWNRSVMKLIRKMNVPIVPLYLSGKNSFWFYFLGLFHPMLRTAQLLREFVNKDNSEINIAVASPVFPAKVKNLEDEEYTKYIRTNLFLLKNSSSHTVQEAKSKSNELLLVDYTDTAQEVIDEIEILKKEHLLFQQGSMFVFFAEPEVIPHTIIEIGRLREITFREVGEGTQKEIDTDQYDEYYRQLFIWDDEKQRIVGGYRVGMGAEIMEKYGKKGFYTNTLFKMSDKMDPILYETLELGRSFIVKEYQKGSHNLMFLWKGILQVLLFNDSYRYLLGPASISSDYTNKSIKLMVSYLKRNHLNQKMSKWISPINPLLPFVTTLERKNVKHINSIEMLDKVIFDIERGANGVPVLIKKYIQLNGEVLSFNIDKDFNDALDVFILLDCQKVPEITLRMLSKGSSEEVLKRFQKKS